MPGFSFLCFSCNSRDDPKCDDTFDLASRSYVDCSSDYFEKLVSTATRNMTDVQDAFLAYQTVAPSKSTCQKLVVKGKSSRESYYKAGWMFKRYKLCDGLILYFWS